MNFAFWVLLALVAALGFWVAWLLRSLDAARADLAGRRKQVELLREEMDARAARLDRYTAVVAGVSLGIVVFDPKGAVLHANIAAQEFVGARHGAALAESRIHRLVEVALKQNERLREEFEIRSPAPRTLLISVEPICDARWAAAYIEDVTDRRKVDAARTDFVANVSHELKTPLGALALLAETLEDTSDPDARQRLVHRIGEQAARMTRLVDDIMDLSLVEAAGMEPAIVEMHKVLAAAVATVRDIAAASDVELDVVTGDEEIYVDGDERQLVSAVANLLSNAVTYTSVATPPQRVVARVSARDNDAVIEVADSGVGIPAKYQHRIFERFYRVDAARSRETGGTGLGLAIVRHVALNHGGSVELESESGVGSTFRIVLPLGGMDR